MWAVTSEVSCAKLRWWTAFEYHSQRQSLSALCSASAADVQRMGISLIRLPDGRLLCLKDLLLTLFLQGIANLEALTSIAEHDRLAASLWPPHGARGDFPGAGTGAPGGGAGSGSAGGGQRNASHSAATQLPPEPQVIAASLLHVSMSSTVLTHLHGQSEFAHRSVFPALVSECQSDPHSCVEHA